MNLPINNYCERMSETFWAEPVNALTNGAFLVAAIAAHLLLKKQQMKRYYFVLPYQLGIVALGSFLWHTARNPVTHILDGGLLYIFIATVLLFLLKTLSSKWSTAWLGVIGLILFQLAVYILIPSLRDTPIRHIIALVTFGLLLIWTGKKMKQIPKSMLIALSLYIGAIAAKSMDLLLCDIFPPGTHFLWHLLGGAASYYAIAALVALDGAVEEGNS